MNPAKRSQSILLCTIYSAYPRGEGGLAKKDVFLIPKNCRSCCFYTTVEDVSFKTTRSIIIFFLFGANKNIFYTFQVSLFPVPTSAHATIESDKEILHYTHVICKYCVFCTLNSKLNMY